MLTAGITGATQHLEQINRMHNEMAFEIGREF